MAALCRAVCLINHNGEPADALVIATNPDGSCDLITVSTDPKRQKKATSADWPSVLDRLTHVQHYFKKLKAALERENTTAEQEGRSADFEGIAASCITESFAEDSRVSKVSSTRDGVSFTVVSSVALFGTEHDELPDPYRVKQPEPPAAQNAAPVAEQPAAQNAAPPAAEQPVPSPNPPPTSGAGSISASAAPSQSGSSQTPPVPAGTSESSASQPADGSGTNAVGAAAGTDEPINDALATKV